MFIWQFFNPEKAILNGQVTLWRFFQSKDAMEGQQRKNFNRDVNEKEIAQTKISSIIGVVGLTLFLIIISLV
ncbi:hypothetical protein [Lysinibacillus sp. OL1]|uniref:hypothetical protein n=1 Tax=Lysinibacillus sp. OL1 TaxID=2517243 RepID=UPI00103D27B7|nr:hypothetical protein [Lysinibacillus sp. OL1]TBV84800.1 hypothetical protein EW028_24080 [Lysinibacillus sp. OL1]